MADKISISYQMIGASAEEGKTKMRGDRGGDGGRGATDKREWKNGRKKRRRGNSLQYLLTAVQMETRVDVGGFVTVSLEESEDRLPSKHRFQEKFPKNSKRRCQ